MVSKSRNAPQTTPCPHIVIQSIQPSIDSGRYPVKRIAGGMCEVGATVFRDGHVKIRAVVRWRRRSQKAYFETPMELANPGLDLWCARFPLEEPGRYLFTVESWTDVYGSWLAEMKKQVDVGQNVASELQEGATLIERVGKKVSKSDRTLLLEAAEALLTFKNDPSGALAFASNPQLVEALDRHDPREDAVVHEPELAVIADREKALVGAWYEMFPRSQGTQPGRSSTFREAESRFPDIRDMGFDVLYLPPIHPIGLTHRKGKDNSLTASPDDPGSPWAIGSRSGGHDAVDPALGTIQDFDHFVEAARHHGLEMALDFALQCSPDHPWVADHPDWFYRHPDGTIKFAENPPKKYEDIYPLNFDTQDREALWNEIRSLFEFWIKHGVNIFRVDNPHTKPVCFWEWLIDDITAKHPEVLFLAEAFTRPPMMNTLAKVGFTQSYTYFTWRNTKRELTEYLVELTQTQMKEYFRPNLFTNTPDILPDILVLGGRPAFKIRLVLAATLAPSYGIYSGFELCENAHIPHHAIPGEYEYADSDKYEIRVRDWNATGNIKGFISLVNVARQENPALRLFDNLRFHETLHDHLICYSKCTLDFENRIIVVVNLNPHAVAETIVHLDLDHLSLRPGQPFDVRDLVTGSVWQWKGSDNYVRLDPGFEPAHVLRIEG